MMDTGNDLDVQDENLLYVSMPGNSEEESTSMKNHIIYLRTQLMQLIESKESKPNCDETLRILLHVDVPLQNKCHSLLLNDLLSKNGMERENLGKLSNAFNILYRYGRNLLKDVAERPQFWKSVKFSNSVFHQKVDSLVGGRHILCQLGYTQEINGGLAFPEYAEPHRDTVVELSADLLIGKYELDIYTKGQHPFPRHIEAHISMTAKVPQALQSTSQELRPTTSTTSDVISNSQPMRQPPTGGVALCGMAPGVGQHLLKKTSPPRQPLSTAQHPGTSNQSGTVIDISSCQLCGVKRDTFQHCQTCHRHQCDSCDTAWHNHPNRKNHERSDIQVSRRTGGLVSSSGQAQNSESHGQTQQAHPMPSANRPSELIREKEMAFTRDGVYAQPRPPPASKPGTTRNYENAEFWTSQLREQFLIAPSDTSLPPANLPKTVSGENTVVVIPKKEVGYAMSHGPSSIQEESMYASMLDETVSENNHQESERGIISQSCQPTNKPVPPPRPNKMLKNSSISPKKVPPPLPPKPPHGKPAKFTSEILDNLLKIDPEIRQVRLDIELGSLEAEIQKLNNGIEIYTKMDGENPECKRMKTQLEERLKDFHVLCEYREKFGVGKYSSDVVVDTNRRGVNNKERDKNIYENIFPKQAWTDKNIPRMRSKPAVDFPAPSQIHFQGLPTGDSRDDDVFRDRDQVSRPGIIPLDKLGTFQPISVQNVPKPDDFRKRVPETPQLKWECQFCTLHNDAGTNRCSACENENINPKYVECGQDVMAAAEKLKELQTRPLAKAFQAQSMQELTLEDKKFKNKFASQTLDRVFAKHEQEKRLQNLQEADGLALIRNIRSFEGGEYDIEQFEIAAGHSDDWGLTPFEWLQQYWDTFKENVIAQANHQGAGDNPNVLTNLTMKEMESALMECKNVDAAIEKCKRNRKEMVDGLKEVTDVPVNDIVKFIGECKGNEDDVITKLNEAVIQTTLDAVWDEEELDIPIRQEEFQEFIQNDNNDKEHRLRALLVQGRLESWEGAEVILYVLHDGSLDLGESTFEDIVDAARNANGDLERCKSYLQQDCAMCFCKFPMNKIRNLIHCQCKMCEGCLTENFQYASRDREARHMACPVCGEPDLQNDEAKADTHFQILDLILKNLLDDAIYQLFQKKLRDRHLMQEPNFRWCAHCECGIIFHNEDGQLKMTCPECRQATCFNCKDKWEPQHEGLTCEQFTQWKIDNDPDRQAAGLARHLHENGIDCPNCKYKYALARGGCIHFICTQCGWNFCSGCTNVFKTGDSCGLFQRCASSGLHCHHPRNCLYYLRDNEVETLKELLKSKDIEFKTDVTPEGEAAEEDEENEETEETEQEDQYEEEKCGVMEQKETPDGLKDELCGKPVMPQEAGLCNVHYKEYLVMLINRHEIDPVAIMQVEDLQRQLERLEKDVPQKRKKETQNQYRKRLQEYIITNVPLTNDHTRRVPSI